MHEFRGVRTGVGLALLLGSLSCEQPVVTREASLHLLPSGLFAVAPADVGHGWRDYVPGSRAQEEGTIISQLSAGLSGVPLEEMRKAIRAGDIVAAPDSVQARLLSRLATIRLLESNAKALAESRRAADLYWPPLAVVGAPRLLQGGTTARLVRRTSLDPTNVLIVDPARTSAADVVVALTALTRYRIRDGDILFAPDMEVSLDFTEAMREAADFKTYPRAVLEALLTRVAKAPSRRVDGVGLYPVDIFPVRSLSGRHAKFTR